MVSYRLPVCSPINFFRFRIVSLGKHLILTLPPILSLQITSIILFSLAFGALMASSTGFLTRLASHSSCWRFHSASFSSRFCSYYSSLVKNFLPFFFSLSRSSNSLQNFSYELSRWRSLPSFLLLLR